MLFWFTLFTACAGPIARRDERSYSLKCLRADSQIAIGPEKHRLAESIYIVGMVLT